MIAADAAATGCQVDIVSDEDGQGIRLNLREQLHEALQFQVEGIDVHLAYLVSGQKRIGDDLALRRGDVDGLRRQYCGRTEEHVVVGVGLDRSPEIAALISINVLSQAKVNSALNKIHVRGKDGRTLDHLNRRQRTEIGYGWIKRHVPILRPVNHLDGDDKYRYGRRDIGRFWIGADHGEGILHIFMGVGGLPLRQVGRGLLGYRIDRMGRQNRKSWYGHLRILGEGKGGETTPQHESGQSKRGETSVHTWFSLYFAA